MVTIPQLPLKQIVLEELRRLFWRRLLEFWTYCAVLFVLSSIAGLLIMGGPGIIFPLAFIFGIGAISAMLFAHSHRENAFDEISERVDEILKARSDIEVRDAMKKLNTPSLSILSQPIFR